MEGEGGFSGVCQNMILKNSGTAWGHCQKRGFLRGVRGKKDKKKEGSAHVRHNCAKTGNEPKKGMEEGKIGLVPSANSQASFQKFKLLADVEGGVTKLGGKGEKDRVRGGTQNHRKSTVGERRGVPCWFGGKEEGKGVGRHGTKR